LGGFLFNRSFWAGSAFNPFAQSAQLRRQAAFLKRSALPPIGFCAAAVAFQPRRLLPVAAAKV
jgi:hypothetical protein